jgi:hypothetical protein
MGAPEWEYLEAASLIGRDVGLAKRLAERNNDDACSQWSYGTAP